MIYINRLKAQRDIVSIQEEDGNSHEVLIVSKPCKVGRVDVTRLELLNGMNVLEGMYFERVIFVIQWGPGYGDDVEFFNLNFRSPQ